MGLIEAEITDVQKFYIGMNFDVLKIKTNFDIPKILKTAKFFIQKHGVLQKDGYKDYFGLGLQYQDEKNPYFDSVMSSDYVKTEKKIHIKKNEIALAFSEIYETFAHIRLTRGRIIIAKPGFVMQPHTDGPCMMTLHVPIKTNSTASIVIGANRYHLPADGSSYLVNATRQHYAENHSDSDRIHITFPVGPPSFINWKRADLGKFESYFKMMNRTPEDFNLKISV